MTQDIITELSAREMAPASGGVPRQLVILLHGYGSDGADLISLAPAFAEVLPDAQFLSPNAPFRCDMSPFGFMWFSLMSYETSAMLAGAAEAAPILNHYIDTSLARFNLTDDKLMLVGFSQGTMMSLYVSLRREKPCAGVLGYSGALLDANPTDKIVKSRPPVCLVHGMADMVVPFMALDAAKRGLQTAGFAVEAHSVPMLGHGIDDHGISVGQEFMQRRLG